MNEIKDDILADAIEAYFEAETKITILEIGVVTLGVMVGILVAIIMSIK